MMGLNKGKSGITLIAPNCTLVGDVYFGDQLLVFGLINGCIHDSSEGAGKATVTISERGRVEGDIRVPNVVVNGEVLGDIHSAKHVVLDAKAQVTGNVYYNTIEMVKGSWVDGNLVHVGAVVPDPVNRDAVDRDPVDRDPVKNEQPVAEPDLKPSPLLSTMKSELV